MTKLLSVLLIAGLAMPAAALADPSKTIVIDQASRDARAMLEQAADAVCAAARAHDLFGDFGTQDECVENTVEAAKPVPLDRDRRAVAISTAQR